MRTTTVAHVFMAFATIVVLARASAADAPASCLAPPNAPAVVRWNADEGTLNLIYRGERILDATVAAKDADGNRLRVALEPTVDTADDKIEQRLVFTAAQTGQPAALVLTGTVTASDEAFPAETDSAAQKRFPYVRNSVGLSRNLRNNAIYDRHWDWVLVGPADRATRIQPQRVQGPRTAFSWESRGASIELTFRPRFYQRHLGFQYFEPWSYRVWKGSVTGYCTWWAYRGGFTQKTLDAMLAVFAQKHLPDFGYRYMQFDNCYQIGNGSCPENWLHWNEGKYPGGWQYAMKTIRASGMQPGIWVHRVHRPSDPHVAAIGREHPDWFVHKADGSLFSHRGFYVLDTTNEEAVENMVRHLYRGLKQQGWDYVKIDGTGDLLNAYRDKNCDAFFRTHPTSPEQSLRTWDVVAREELGPDVYILACHTVGNARNVIGLVDGARLSNDGFQPRTLAQYNFLEGVVWRGDPDHCDVMGGWLMDQDAMMPVFAMEVPVPARSVIRPALCAMAGSVLMVSDKVEVYQDDRNLEGMKRSAPVLSTVPGQLYSCGRQTAAWWLQEIDRPFDHWSVLARFQWGPERRGQNRTWELQGVAEQEVAFADVGLHDDRPYLVFEFWSQRFLGEFQGSFIAPRMDDNTVMQVFAIREAREHPWIISTTRHVSQGGVSLVDEQWDAGANVLAGKSAVVIGDPYVMTVQLPQGFRLENAVADSATVEFANRKDTATVRIVPTETKTLGWSLTFAR